MKSVITVLVCAFIIHHTNAQDQWKNIYRESAWAERDQWQGAGELIRLLDIKQASQVADLGCHEGYMTTKLSPVVGTSGKVFAVDIDQSRLNLLKNHLEDRKIGNVTLIKGEYDNPKLPTNALDAVLILDAYHEMDKHDEILKHIKVALKQGGRLLLCEPISETRRNFSRTEQERKHEIGINFALEDLKKCGFEIKIQKDPFVDRTGVKGDVMWVILAIKK